MIEWLISVSEKCRSLSAKANDAKNHLEVEPDAANTINGYMRADYDALVQIWKQVAPELKGTGRLNDLGRHINFGMSNDYDDIIKQDVPSVLKAAEVLACERSKEVKHMGFESLLHPAIVDSSLAQYRNGHVRDAVLNAVISVFDMIRARTGLKLDGKDLVGQAFEPIRASLSSVSSQRRAAETIRRASCRYMRASIRALRNVNAHSLTHDLDEQKGGTIFGCAKSASEASG